ncbi:MAG: Ig-like domain-containing protein, partial [Oscillospiraceae bacterium]|nr:Ig-like domain-containing protein [Oscillospiraceae bacterium]
MKKTFERLLSVLLVLVMVLGFVPGGVLTSAKVQAAEAEEGAVVVYDFKAFAEKSAAAAEDDKAHWWNLLPAGGDDYTKVAGCVYAQAMQNPTAYNGSSNSMLAALADENWAIDDATTVLTNSYYAKRIWLNADPEVEWGMALCSGQYTAASNPARARLGIDIEVETAGQYRVDLNAYLTGETLPQTGVRGNGAANLYVNGVLVKENVSFGAETSGTETINVAEYVTLEEGTNQIIVECTRASYVLYMNDLTITELVCDCEELTSVVDEGKHNEHREYDLCETCGKIYNEEIVACTEGDEVLVCGVCGAAMDCTHDNVSVTAFDYKKMMKAASKTDWWAALPTVNTAGGVETKRVGNAYGTSMTADEVANYEEMQAWFLENYGWQFGDDSKLTINFGNRVYLCADDSISWGIWHHAYFPFDTNRNKMNLEIEADAAGWYEMTLDVQLMTSNSMDYPKDAASSTQSAGGYSDVYLNGELVKEAVFFGGSNEVTTVSIGAVYLEEGTNAFNLQIVKNNAGGTTGYGGAVAANLCNMNLMALETVPNMDGSHSLKAECEKCGLVWGGTLDEECSDFDEDGYCDSCGYLLNCSHPETEENVRPIGKNQHQYYETCLVEGCGAELEGEVEDCSGVEICEICGGQIKDLSSIKIDFLDLFQKASAFSWWNDLEDAKEDTKQVGSTSTSDAMTPAQTAAYEKLRAYMLEQTGWTINESMVMATNPYVAKQVFFTTSEKAGWGIAVYPTYLAHADRSRLAFDVTVEQEGWYNLTLGTYKDSSTGTSATYTGKYLGGGKANVYLGSEKLYHEYSFGGANYYSADSMGMVYLNEGVNTITFDCVKDYNNTTSNGRRCIFIKDISLNLMSDVEVEEGLSTTMDLRTSYLQFDTVIDSTYSVVSDDEQTAEAAFDADGNLVIKGVAEGSTDLSVSKDGEAICDIPVKVVPKTSLFYDFSKGSTKTAGKKGFAAIKDFDDLPDDGVTSDLWYTSYVGDSAKWNEANATAVVKGQLQLVLDVTAEGWHDTFVDLYLQDGGKDVKFWLTPGTDGAYDDATYMGTLNTYSAEKAHRTLVLRSAQLEEGRYTLTIETEGELWLNSLQLKPADEPKLLLEAKAIADKQGRTMETAVTARWDNGMAEDLVGARWRLVRSAEGVTPRIEGTTLLVTGDKPGEYTVDVYATVGGVEGMVEVPVTVYAPSQLASADVAIHNVLTGQVARNTVQYFDFTLIGEDGEEIYFNETEVNYTASVEDVVEFLPDEGAFMGIANGETDITVEVPAVGFSKTFHVTVDDMGENLLRNHDGDFEFGEPVSNAIWHWQPGFGTESSQYKANAWAFGEVIEEEDGNHCFALSVNPNGAYNINTTGTEMVLGAGNYVPLEPGRMYEFSMRARSENMAAPDGAAGGLMYSFQVYDFAAQARGSTIQQVYTSVTLEQNDPEWETYKLRVMAPVEHDGTFYVMPRVILRQENAADYNLTGFTGTAYVDDFQFREVGFDRLETVLESNPKDTVTPVNMAIHAYSTTGCIVDIGADDMDIIDVYSTNEDVVVVEGAVERIKDLNGTYMPIVPVRLVGMNAEAELITTVNIHGRELMASLDMTTTGLEEVMRDVVYTLDEAGAANLKVGESAVGDLNGRTTQLVPITEEYIRAHGNIYFKSTDTKVATVDQTTGDVTAVGEGTATVTAYALVEGITRSSSVVVNVTDDTDLVAIKLATPVSYVGAYNTMNIALSGTKASGGPADMSKFAVAFTVDEEAALGGIATVDEDGILSALKPGTVTVTAAASVNGEVVSDSITLTVIANEELPGENVIVDFTDGRTIFAEKAVIDVDGYEINRELTHGKGASISHGYKGGLSFSPGVGNLLAVDVFVPKSGWYATKTTGAVFSYGGVSDVFVDDSFVGVLDNKNGGSGSHYGAISNGNVLWLDAGVHTWTLKLTASGSIFLGTLQLLAVEDPNEITVEMSLKDELMIGETATVQMDIDHQSVYGKFSLKAVNAQPEYTNYYYLTSSDSKVATVANGVVTGRAAGTATITLVGEINGTQQVYGEFEVLVAEGVIASAELTAEATTLKPTDDGTQLSVVGYDTAGIKLQALPEDITVTYTAEENDILTVSEEGYVSLTGKEGSARITAEIVENGRHLEASIWITVTTGKTQPTLFTYEERAIAQENTLKYNWAWEEKEAAVAEAEYYVEHLDQVYDMLIYETFPRSTAVGFKSDPEQYTCRYCNYDLNLITSHYGWLVDPIENPWKITCPVCNRDFPSNDFGAYYESGLDEYGRFHAEDADPQYLVNELYPEMGEGWGVDDGFGYVTGDVYYNGVQEVHTYIAYYMHCVFDGLGKSEHAMTDALDSLRKAYLYTGDEKYGSAGAILINRVADIYPEYDIHLYSYNYPAGDGNSHKGKFIGSIWEATTMGQCLAQAADAFWPAMDNDDVIEYLKARTEEVSGDPNTITPEYVRENVDEGVLLEIKKAVENGYADGNFGMEQAAMAYAAVALDRLPETEEMIDWIFRYGEKTGTGLNTYIGGGLVMYNIVNLVCRDGFGNEGSHAYNAMWYTNLMEAADALDGYTRVEGADLWANPKFVNMVGSMMKLTTLGCVIPSFGEAGHIQFAKSGMDVDSMLAGFIKTGNRDLAVSIYAANGNTVDGLHGTIFTPDPESGIKGQIEQIVAEDGYFNFSESNMLCGLGMAFLREGPEQYLGTENADQFSDYWMFFGRSAGGAHTNLDALNIDIDAFGLNLSSDLGYPTTVNAQSPERMQWTLSTSSHNTVVVNDKAQRGIEPNHFPMHFEDSGKAKVMDADASRVYEETDIYRRTMVVMDNGNGVNYAVDFFRILGGREHVYSFHAATMLDPVATGLDFTYQPMGTYAGADVAFGDHTVNPYTTDAAANQGNGYSWLKEVNRDGDPDTYFALDWPVQDFKDRVITSPGIHLKLHMVSEEPLTEVATAHGQPPQNGSNPEFIEYAMIRRSGMDGMDTLFTSVIEPYQYDSYIDTVELLDVALVEGTEGVTDKAAALKITLLSGREDYIVYATNPDCLYSICENGEEVFKFKGFAGVCSYEGGIMTYAWGSEVTTIADADKGAVIDDVLPAATGIVTDFTKGLADEYTMTIRLDQQLTSEDLAGRYIYVNNDRQQNGAYRIYGAQVKDNVAVLDLHTQDMVRSYVDPTNIDAGYVHNIAEGQTFSIPLSATFDVAALLNFTEDRVVKTGYRIDLQIGVEGSGATYEIEGLAKGMKFDAETGKITWTPTKTQVGRYPIVIKAVDGNGNVLATTEFTIYAVAYTGVSYDPSVCKHVKAITYDVDGITETVCPACGTVTKTGGEEEPEEKPIELIDIAGTNMNLGNELALNFMFPKALDESKSYTAIITQTSQG